MFILGVIPARKNSQRIKNKNIFPLNKKPLIDYTIESAINSDLNDFVITSDIDVSELMELQKNVKRRFCIHEITEQKWQPRPKSLSRGQYNSAIHTVKYAVRRYEKEHRKVDAVCLLQPTSPLRIYSDINKAIEVFLKYKRSLYSGYHIKLKHKNKIFNKDDEPHFQRNGAIFITPKELLFRGKFWDEDVIELVMPAIRSIDIDEMDDMATAELLIKGGVI